MATNKTVATKASVDAYVKKIGDAKKRKDFSTLVDMITASTKFEPIMWGTAIVGFGSYHYKYDSGREGDAPLAGLAARANAITLYLGSEFDKREELLANTSEVESAMKVAQREVGDNPDPDVRVVFNRVLALYKIHSVKKTAARS